MKKNILNQLPVVKTMGVITNEFFEEKLGGFGGFGFTAKNLIRYYSPNNQRAINAKLIIAFSFKRSSLAKSPDFGKILLIPSLLKMIFQPFRIIREIRSMNLDFFLTIDYLVRYEYVIWVSQEIPIVIYLRDPRAHEELAKLAANPLEFEANYRRNKKDLLRKADQEAASFKRISKWSKRIGRSVIFATNAEFLIERAQRKFNIKKITPYYLPNPIELPDITEIAYAQNPMIFYLGRLDPQKRPWIVFELARQLPEIKFIIAGSSRFPNLVDYWIKEYDNLPNLEKVGAVHGKEKEQFLKGCWGLINTSIHEGLPVSFLETFSYGKCVISCQNPDNLVEKFGYFTGYLPGEGKDQETVEAFKSQILKCISDPELRKKKGTEALEYVHRNHSFFNFENHLKKIMESEIDIQDKKL